MRISAYWLIYVITRRYARIFDVGTFSRTRMAIPSAYVCPQQEVNELDKRWSWELGQLGFLLQFCATRVSELQYVCRIWHIYEVKFAPQLKLVPESIYQGDWNAFKSTCMQKPAARRDAWPPWTVVTWKLVVPIPLQGDEKLPLPEKYINFCDSLQMCRNSIHLMKTPFRLIHFCQLEEYLVPWSWCNFVDPTVEEGEWFKVHEAPLWGWTCSILQHLVFPCLVLRSQSILLTHFRHPRWTIPIHLLVKQRQNLH